jgi:hypothetical protein
MPMDQDALIAAIETARENAYGSDHGTELGSQRARCLESYLGYNTNPAPEGRSQVVDRSVYETIQVMLPSLVRIFASSSDEICKAIPVGPDDEQSADQTTAVLNWVVRDQNNWEQICADWLHDAMLLMNGYCLAYWDESENIIREKYEGQSDDQMAQLLSDTDIQVIEHSQGIDEEATVEAQKAYQSMAQQAQVAMSQGQQVQLPPPPGPIAKHDLVIERRESAGKICLRVLPPEHCYVSAETPNWTLDECDYFEFRQKKTIAALRAMGLDVPDDISDEGGSEFGFEDEVRDRFGDDTTGDDSKGPMRQVWARMVWIRADVEGDDLARMYYVIMVGRTVLYVEPCARIPVASMTAQPLPHRHIGMSVAETVIDIQEIRTAVTRGALDNLYLANNGRHAVSQHVNLDDLLDSRPGGIVRLLDDAKPGDGHILPLSHPFAFNEIVGSLEYFDQVRQNRTGASRYFSGTDAGAINKTAAGTSMLQNAASQRVEHIARMMAPAVESLFSAVHEIWSKHRNKALTIKLRSGQWVSVDPQSWRTKRDIRISVGVGAGNKESMQAQLAQIFGAQMQLIPMGIAGPAEVHATVTEMAKMAGFSNPGKFWLDPTTRPPMQQPPSPEQIKAQTEMQKMQFAAQQDQMKAQADQALEQHRIGLEMQKERNKQEYEARQKALELEQAAQLEALRASYQAQQDAAKLEFERWKAELDASVKLQIAGMSTTEQTEPDDRLDQVIASLEALAAEVTAPSMIVRDPKTGRAVGVQKGSRTMHVMRDESGRATGVQ